MRRIEPGVGNSPPTSGIFSLFELVEKSVDDWVGVFGEVATLPEVKAETVATSF